MKALQSKLAAQLLADPVAREQLRAFLANRQAHAPDAKTRDHAPQFVIHSASGGVTVQATLVPKAAVGG